MEKIEVKLEKDNNDFFREWIIKEWQHHNTVDPIYQLRIIKPEELKFKENEEYYKILYNNKMVGFIGIKNYEKEIYLYRFFIDEKYRNNGVGTNDVSVRTKLNRRYKYHSEMDGIFLLQNYHQKRKDGV